MSRFVSREPRPLPPSAAFAADGREFSLGSCGDSGARPCSGDDDDDDDDDYKFSLFSRLIVPRERSRVPTPPMTGGVLAD